MMTITHTMTAPDKPLHERIADYLAQPISKAEFFNPRAYVDTLLREAAEALRNAVCTHGVSMGSACQACAKVEAERKAELSRMRTALEELIECKDLRDKGDHLMSADQPDWKSIEETIEEYETRMPLAWEAARAAIAERALTAGSGNE